MNKKLSDYLQIGVLITLLLTILKVGGWINWSWIWVFMPVWLPVASTLFFVTIIVIIVTIIKISGD